MDLLKCNKTVKGVQAVSEYYFEIPQHTSWSIFQSKLYSTHQVYGYSINVQSLHFTWMQRFSLNSINAFTIFVWSLTNFFFLTEKWTFISINWLTTMWFLIHMRFCKLLVQYLGSEIRIFYNAQVLLFFKLVIYSIWKQIKNEQLV